MCRLIVGAVQPLGILFFYFLGEPTVQKMRNFRPGHVSVWEEEERPVRSGPFDKLKASAEMPPRRT